MSEILQYLISGIAIGSIYSLVALGFCIMWSTSQTVNFSNGDSAMLGAVLGVVLCVDMGLPLWLGLLAVIILGSLFGVIVQNIGVRPFRGKSEIGWMLSTIAIGIILRNVAMVTFGTYDRSFPTPWVEKPVFIFGAGIYPQELLIPVAALALMFVIFRFYYKTNFGSGLRAVSFHQEAASLMGIKVPLMINFSYALATAIAALAGFLVAPIILASSHMGLLLGLKGFSVAVIGGITNPFGAIITGILFGIMEYMVVGFISTAAREIVSFSVVIAVLMISPKGIFDLFGKKGREA